MLMIPGPSQPDPEVLAALSQPVLPHYGREWKAIYDDTTSDLKKVFATKKDVLLVPVPGQVALEMAAVNLVGRGGTGFVCVNGVFSGMVPEIIKRLGGRSKVIRASLGRGVTPEQVKESLDSVRDPAGMPLFIVHTETSTGAASDAAEVFKVCKKRGVITVLDAISSFGGMDIQADEWGADMVLGYASKALGGVFGAQPLAVGKAVWDASKKNRARIHSYFLDLNVWRESIEEDSSWGHPYPSSMPTSVIVAMRKAVELVLREGLANRYRRHASAARQMREGFTRLGLETFTNPAFFSNTVSVARVNPAWGSKVRTMLLDRHDIMIANGLGPLSGKVIRIGHMGTSATHEAISMTVDGLADVLRSVRDVPAAAPRTR